MSLTNQKRKLGLETVRARHKLWNTYPVRACAIRVKQLMCSVCVCKFPEFWPAMTLKANKNEAEFENGGNFSTIV